MRMHALILICLLSLLTACAKERIVTVPEIVEVVNTEYVEVPGNLLIKHQKTTIPETLTYGDAILLWAEDRRIIETQNGQLLAIQSLGED